MADLSDLKAIIVDQTPIVQIVSHYIAVTRKGNANLAICPFHNDSKPSLNITNDRKMFKCFSCGAGGNAVDFVMRFKTLEFKEALEEISKNIGVNYEDYDAKRKRPVSPKHKMAEKLLVKVTQLYCKFAETSCKDEFNHFLESRKIDFDLSALYRLGFAPKGNVLINYLKSIPNESERKLAIEVAFEIGLIKADRNREKEHYDTFRERIIFPIWDQYGHTIGYQSRVIRKEVVPKYLNSKESFVFSKKNLLYGLHLAKESIRQKDFVILVEGNMDQIALYNQGFKNVVAIMGIALGDNSLKALSKITKNFLLALDDDNAGREASSRINKQCMEVGITPKVVHFDNCKDPDDFLIEHGALAMQKKIDTAEVYVDFQLNALIPKEIPTVMMKRLELLDSVFPVISPLKDSLEGSERLMSFAARLGLMSKPEAIQKRYQDYLKGLLPSRAFKKPVQEVKKEESFSDYELHMMGDQDTGDTSYYEAMNEFYGNEVDEHVDMHAASSQKEEIDKNELIFVQEVVQYPEVLTSDKIRVVLDFVRSSEVELYVLKLRDLVYEIDESEYACVVDNITRSDSISDSLKAAALAGLRSHRPKNLDDKMIIKLLGETRRKLEFGQLRREKELIKSKRMSCNTEDEMREFMNELLIVEQKLNKLKSQKNL